MRTVYVAMSGGVDSSVAAAVLKKQGFRVVGVFMKPWSPSGRSRGARQLPCLWQTEREDALRVAAHLGIPLKTWDFSRQYGAKVAAPMVAGYRRGITPNPDVECNRHIKFGLFAQRAFREGADLIATGHYARIRKYRVPSSEHQKKETRFSQLGTRYGLATARDSAKDQTYFLWAIPPSVLARTLFPVGHLTKPQVRAIARRSGLPVADKKDSQGICFVGDLDVKGFLERRIASRQGRILHSDGRVLGTHDGAAYYTIGQRHGLDIRDGGGPYFVVSKDMRRNTVTVGSERALVAARARMTGTNWFGVRPKSGELVMVKIRYRTPALPATMSRGGIIRFAKPARAIAAGQSAVIYRGSRLLGGGILR